MSDEAMSEPAVSEQAESWWSRRAVLTVSAAALLLYGSTAAPGLTWAHFGADGGDLLAAAVTNGVPHPSGYPLYILLLQGWLGLGCALLPLEPARLGTLLSVLCAGLSAGLTVATAAYLLRDPHCAPHQPAPWARPLWAALAGLAWMAAPLVWSQAIITEVYALHMLLAALIGWAALTGRGRLLALALGLGVAHHVTSVLLWPAVLWWLWPARSARLARIGRIFGAALLIGGVLYLRIPWAAAAAPPVNWGYADTVEGFWWLVSGQAYRGYLFGVPLADLPGRAASWAQVLAAQFTPLGLGVALAGLAAWDRHWPRLRTFGLLWVVPVSLYSITYYTVDSQIYLLPVIWMAALWFANGLAVGVDWLQRRSAALWPGRAARVTPQRMALALAALVAVGLTSVAALRLPELSLRQDRAAQDFLAAAAATLEPNSLVISRSDAQTFALWYGVWGSDALDGVPGLVLINDALYHFDWYRRLLADLYPQVPGIGGPFYDLLRANAALRPVFLAEPLTDLPGARQAVGPFWRLEP